jgi:hypothetical protein
VWAQSLKRANTDSAYLRELIDVRKSTMLLPVGDDRRCRV